MSHADSVLVVLGVLIWLHGVVTITYLDKRTTQILKAIQEAKKGDQL